VAESDELQLEELVRLRTEIREKLDRLSATYRAMDGKLDRLSEKLDGLSEKLARVRSSLPTS